MKNWNRYKFFKDMFKSKYIKYKIYTLFLKIRNTLFSDYHNHYYYVINFILNSI